MVAKVFKCVSSVFLSVSETCFNCLQTYVQPLDLDVSKVDRVLLLSSSHLLLHRLSRSRQGIHTNEGWTMGAGRGSSVRTDAAFRAGWALGGGGCVVAVGSRGASLAASVLLIHILSPANTEYGVCMIGITSLTDPNIE